MQTLSVANSTPRSDNRLKSLFWPSVESASDVDYLGAQGYWVCAMVALVSLLVFALAGHWITGILVFLFYFVGGVGVRERSRYAAAAVFVMFAFDTAVSQFSVLRILLCALLLSNVRAIWVASGWLPESKEAAAPPRFSETWSDKFADQLPSFLWPKIRIPFYIYSVAVFVLFSFVFFTALAIRLVQ